jgi:cytochrome P450
METLRLSQAEYLYRTLRQDVVFDELLLPKGWLVRICVWESHRSPEMFNDAERFNPDRFLAEDFPQSTYSPFGADRHACNGVPLTNAVCRTFLEQLTQRYQWSVEGHEELERDFRHWSHWRPGANLRFGLEPVAAPLVSARDANPGVDAAPPRV